MAEKFWTEDEILLLQKYRKIDKKEWNEIGFALHRSPESCRCKYKLVKDKEDVSGESSSVDEGYDFLHIISSSKRLLSVADVVKQFNVDLSVWEVDKIHTKVSEGYRKDRKVEWHVSDGLVSKGDVSDSGKMLVVPLYHLEVHFKKKLDVVKAKSRIDDFIEDANKFSPNYPKLVRSPYADKGMLYEIDFPDLHFGRLTWAEESSENYDIKIAAKLLMDTVRDLLSMASHLNIGKILIPLGNDFFNVDNANDTTSHGTPQQEDTRSQKTFRAGRKLCVDIIDMCTTVADVDVLIIPGNHDELRSFYLGDSLECWYRNSKNVHIDNSAISRKYYAYGKCLIGFAHGYFEKLDKLPFTMALEQPELWGNSLYREIHTGDKHNKKDISYFADEGTGVVVRILRSLASIDAWTYKKCFVGTVHAGEAFVWHPENGLVAQFTSAPTRSEE